MDYLAHVEAASLKMAGHISHVAQGEDGPLVIQQSGVATGGLSELLTIPAGNFTFEPTQGNFDGHADSATAYQRTLTVGKEWITSVIDRQALVVDWQGTRYNLQVEQAPESLAQFWTFLAVPAQKI